MANATCNYIIPAGATNQGGKLQGAGFNSGNTPPMINRGESLTVKVQWAGPRVNAPGNLTGYFVFSSAPLADAAQNSPSPFVSGARYNCLVTQTAPQSDGNGPLTYTFPAIVYGGDFPGKYELTFVAQTGTNSDSPQWSADPEFDTSS